MDPTLKLIAAYFAMSGNLPMFFSGMFQTPPSNFHTSEKVRLDVTRNGQDVAIVVQDLSVGYRYNGLDTFETKEFTPPVFKEAFPVNSADLLKRIAGVNPLAEPDIRANLIMEFFAGMKKVDGKVRRAIELQASQVLQTGKVKLYDDKGNDLYVLDYQPRAEHFPTAGTAWDQPGADPMGDLEALSETIRDNGLMDPDDIYFGKAAWTAFMANEKLQKMLDIRNMNVGNLDRAQKRGNGATYRGTIDIGAYSFNLWTYNGKYVDPQTKKLTNYLKPGNVVMRASDGRLDGTFGAIPNIGQLLGAQPTQILTELPGRVNDSDSGIDLFTNTWLTPDGEQLFGGVGARPLMIPTAIDTFGCLDTGIA